MIEWVDIAERTNLVSHFIKYFKKIFEDHQIENAYSSIPNMIECIKVDERSSFAKEEIKFFKMMLTDENKKHNNLVLKVLPELINSLNITERSSFAKDLIIFLKNMLEKSIFDGKNSICYSIY